MWGWASGTQCTNSVRTAWRQRWLHNNGTQRPGQHNGGSELLEVRTVLLLWELRLCKGHGSGKESDEFSPCNIICAYRDFFSISFMLVSVGGTTVTVCVPHSEEKWIYNILYFFIYRDRTKCNTTNTIQYTITYAMFIGQWLIANFQTWPLTHTKIKITNYINYKSYKYTRVNDIRTYRLKQ